MPIFTGAAIMSLILPSPDTVAIVAPIQSIAIVAVTPVLLTNVYPISVRGGLMSLQCPTAEIRVPSTMLLLIMGNSLRSSGILSGTRLFFFSLLISMLCFDPVLFP